MHGIVTMLDPTHNSLVESLWQDLEEHCGLRGVRITPIPHFSWQIADEYDLQSTGSILEEICASTRPFMVLTTGLGIFSGMIPVLYIQVVKNSPLIHLHEALWQATLPVCRGRSPYYSPEMWQPHITLAHGDVNPENLNCAVSRLAFGDYNWEFPVDHLSLVYQPEGQEAWLRMRYDFSGGRKP